MKNYIPFLKTKTHEFSCIKDLESNIVEGITPFFDLHRKSTNYTETEYKIFIPGIMKKCISNLKKISIFYLDDYDMNDDLIVDGKQSYNYVLNVFKDLNFIPVIGIDRSDERNKAVLSNKNIIKSGKIAIRLSLEDIQTSIFDLKLLIEDAKGIFDDLELIIDLKVVSPDDDVNQIFNIIDSFLSKKIYDFSKIIITGSSISNVISDLVATDSTRDILRKEVSVFSLISSKYSDLWYGDYTLVSPFYSEFEVDPTMYQNITTAKVIYSYADRHFIIRGGSLKKKGYIQYKHICTQMSQKPFFRKASYSQGDAFIANAHSYPKQITAATILKPTINAHINYMYKDFVL